MANEMNQDLERVVQAAQDAVTDDMVSRLSQTATDAMDLMDRVTRSGVDKAIPAIAEMVNNGDLERLVQMARVVGSAQDAVTDDMVSRLADTASGTMDLLDRVNRSGIERALPILARLESDGDLERVAQLVRMIGAAQDAMTDDMVVRLADTVSNGMSLVDRLHRGGIERLVSLLERMESKGELERMVQGLANLADRMELLEQMLGCVDRAGAEFKKGAPARGGIGSLLSMMTNAENQETLRFVFALGMKMRTTCVTKEK